MLGEICALTDKTWMLVALFVADKVLEFWLGRTDRVKAGSALELILNSLRALIKRRKT